MPSLSIVVPVYNEDGNVEQLHTEILDVCQKEGYTFEIIFVDDGSTDRTRDVCMRLSPLKYIRMRKNFGQTAAMDAGIKAAQYDYIITMDGDRQNDPADIPRLIQYLEENDLDVVSGWRKNRKDTFMKRFTSRGANLLRGLIVKDHIHDSGCSLKIYRRECFDGVNLYGEVHRFIPALLEIKGFTVGEIVVNHRPRTSGVTKYNWKRTIKGFVDMISIWFWNRYAVRPLHILGGIIIRWSPSFVSDLLHLHPFQSWKVYSEKRGMSPLVDIIDWAGGYPFEVAKPEEIFDFFSERGFVLVKMSTVGGGLGCNQFVFQKNNTEGNHKQ